MQMHPLPPRFGRLLLLLPLAACVPGPPPPASQYRQVEQISQLPLLFAPGTAQPTPDEDARLRSLGQTQPVQVVFALHATGPLADSRAGAVARWLGRPVQLVAVPGMPPDQALLVISSPAIVADACRGPGVPEPGSIWPSNDDATPWLLPAGCATEMDILAQTTRPADLLQGRPLPPGAATPFAAAIERYYHRNDAAQQSSASQGGNQQQAAGDQSGSGGTSGASGSTPAVLVGPLPSGGQTGQ